MPIQNALKPAPQPLPADFLAWLDSLHRFKRLALRDHTNPLILRFDTHKSRPHHNTAVTVYSEVLLDSAPLFRGEWRSYVARQIRGMRLHCQRNLNPASVGWRK